MAGARKAPRRPAERVQPSGAGLRVLVAEDNEFERMTFVRMLESLGAREVVEAANGAEALALLQSATAGIDVVVLDLEMPTMDGLECLRFLGERDAQASVIVVSVHDRSLHNAVEAMCRAYGLRPLGVLEKPVTLERLRAALALHDPLRPPFQRSVPSGAPQYSLEEILRGIERGEVVPLYQAKADMATGAIVGAEALARWRLPDKNMVLPMAFVPKLEAAGMIDGLTMPILGRAASDCRMWCDHGCDMSVSVNLSLASLADVSLAERITEAVRAAGCDPRRVVLEITETAAMLDIAPALENLLRLRMRGFELSIDDFGTGFSSIQQLARVPFTELKIDRSFVANVVERREAQVIVASSIDMARKLDIRSVAEGIETWEEWEALRVLGCDAAQGYFISRPIERDALIALYPRGMT